MHNLWWRNITKAHKFMNDIVNLLGEGSLMLSLPKNLPWKKHLRTLISEELKFNNPRNLMEIINASEGEPGELLLKKYCKKEIRAKYRYGISYAEFLGKCKETVLNDRYVWVENIDENQLNQWLNFVTEYNSYVEEKNPAIFILETNSMISNHKSKKGIKKLSYHKSLDKYDCFAFCALAATVNTDKTYMSPYLAELVSTICNNDVELCAQCVCFGNQFLEDPINVLKTINETKIRSNGMKFDFNLDDNKIHQDIWATQLRNIFPIVEKYRNKFIKIHYEDVKKILPINNPYMGEIDKPEDVEIGVLFYFANNGEILVQNDEMEKLNLFYSARNKMAHLQTMDFDDVKQILKYSQSL